MYLDTEGGFRPEKIVRVAEKLGLDPAQVLDNITYLRLYNSDDQVDVFSSMTQRLAEEKYSLIICDSATSLFRVDYSGRGELSERQQKLNRFLSSMRKAAVQFNISFSNRHISDA